MNYVGMQPILVHGGGKAINEAMKTAGLEPQMVQGRRYTDERTLAIAEHVLCNQINRFIVNFIQSQGCEAMGCTRSAATCCSPRRRTSPAPTAAASISGGRRSEKNRNLHSRKPRHTHMPTGNVALSHLYIISLLTYSYISIRNHSKGLHSIPHQHIFLLSHLLAGGVRA
jgi:hypothetical protein